MQYQNGNRHGPRAYCCHCGWNGRVSDTRVNGNEGDCPSCRRRCHYGVRPTPAAPAYGFQCPHANCTLDFAHDHPPSPPITQPRAPYSAARNPELSPRDIIAQDNAAEIADTYGQDFSVQQLHGIRYNAADPQRRAYHLTDLQLGLIVRALRIYDEHSPDDYAFKRRLANILEIAMTDSRDSYPCP